VRLNIDGKTVTEDYVIDLAKRVAAGEITKDRARQLITRSHLRVIEEGEQEPSTADGRRESLLRSRPVEDDLDRLTAFEVHDLLVEWAWALCIDPDAHELVVDEVQLVQCGALGRCDRKLGGTVRSPEGYLSYVDDDAPMFGGTVGAVTASLVKEHLGVTRSQIRFSVETFTGRMQLLEFGDIDDRELHPAISLICRRHGERMIEPTQMLDALALGMRWVRCADPSTA
jgi:hypothetical protein